MHKNVGIVKSGGVEIRGMKDSLAPRRQQVQADPKWEQYSFTPYLLKKVKLFAYSHLFSCYDIKLNITSNQKSKLILGNGCGGSCKCSYANCFGKFKYKKSKSFRSCK